MEFDTRKYTFFYFVLVLIIVAASCANPVSPTGGPKDITPPEIVNAQPPNLSTNYTGNRIVLTFNEYVMLKEINQQLIISPPLAETPNFRMKGKSLVADFKNPWRQETTYNIFFGDALVDITESNPLSGFKFTFSTGSVLDSMIIEGKLISAFNLAPVKGAYVMLYDSVYDSIPYKQLPYYIARTNDQGDFSLTNLRNQPYLLFALSDINANYLFDQPNEEIAFSDTLIMPWLPAKESGKRIGLNDSLQQTETPADTVIIPTGIPADSVIVPTEAPADTVVMAVVQDTIMITDTLNNAIPDSSVLKPVVLAANKLLLLQFREIDTVQDLQKTQLLRQNVLQFIFKAPAKNPQFKILNEGFSSRMITAANRMNDSITMWLPGYDADSIQIVVFESGMVPDTVEMAVKPADKNINKNKEPQVQSLKMTSNLVTGKLKPGSSLRLSFPDPIALGNTEALELKMDSIVITDADIRFTDSLKRQLLIKYPWKQGTRYTLTVRDSVFQSIMGLANDSTQYKFTPFTEEETSSLTLRVDLPEPEPYIIQLLDTKDKVLEQYFISDDQQIDFSYLTPGKYKVKAIHDRNNNGKWDTGKYLLKRFPERVIFYPTEIELRANWTVDEPWQIPSAGK